MQYFVFQSIAIASVAGFVFGALWYSPILFMHAWLYGEGTTKAETPKRSKLYLLQTNLYSLVAHGAVASVLALLFDLLEVPSLKVAVSLGLLVSIGFIVTTRYIDMLYTVHENHWSRRSQVKFLVSSGYYMVLISIMSSVLFLAA